MILRFQEDRGESSFVLRDAIICWSQSHVIQETSLPCHALSNLGYFVTRLACFIFCAAGMSSLSAAPVSVKGLVEFVRTHDATQFPAWVPPRFWFSLKGISRAGSCATWNGTVLFVGNDKQELSLVIAAQVSGQEIAVNVDDSLLVNSFCSVGTVTIGNPAPLN